jgi:hypothetical protein
VSETKTDRLIAETTTPTETELRIQFRAVLTALVDDILAVMRATPAERRAVRAELVGRGLYAADVEAVMGDAAASA